MVLPFARRPTSPLDSEPLETAPEDNLWPGSDDEADEDQRAKKRLRLETLGKQYLDGRPLFIQSAGLKGPFDRGWINPWANRKRKYEVEVRQYSETSKVGGRDIFATCRGKSEVVAGVGLPSQSFGREVTREEPIAKRRRHEEEGASSAMPNAEKLLHAAQELSGVNKINWLKTDKVYLQSRSRDGRVSPTPTPTTRPRTKPLATPPQKAFSKPELSLGYSGPQKRRLLDDVQPSGFTPINKPPGSKNEDSQSRTRKHPSNYINDDDNYTGPFEDPITTVRERKHSKADTSTRQGYEEVKRLSQGAVKYAEMQDAQCQPRKPLQKTSVGAYQSPPMSKTSRLAPYVSELVISEDVSATSGLKASVTASKPSTCAAPPSNYLPEFQYRYARKGSSSGSSRERLAFIKAPPDFSMRARSTSTSSSGSSEFAEKLEAAQAKAASGSSGSFYRSSPIIERHETKSVKKNTQAMRRLTFTASGEPRVAGSRTSSRPGSSSSSAGVPSLVPKREERRSDGVQDAVLIRQQSTKSSDNFLINGNQSRNSAILPEAQVVSDAPIQLAQVPTGSSTNLLETDKQSPNFINLDEEDSYLELSTQAAMTKAQSRFKEEVFSDSPEHARWGKTKSAGTKPFGKKFTPPANGDSKNRNADQRPIKPEPEDEEPMSTQAITDVISPFVVTTIKKRAPQPKKRTSFAPSPTRNDSPSRPPIHTPDTPPMDAFYKRLSMSTTPSKSQQKPPSPIPLSLPHTNSKPPSSSTSFSVLPNGTLTSTSLLQDGQQPQQDFDVSLPLDPFGTPFGTAYGTADGHRQPSSWDMNTAIDEAGSFLGNWDVETEARKEGSSSRKRESENGPRGILAGGRGSR